MHQNQIRAQTNQYKSFFMSISFPHFHHWLSKFVTYPDFWRYLIRTSVRSYNLSVSLCLIFSVPPPTCQDIILKQARTSSVYLTIHHSVHIPWYITSAVEAGSLRTKLSSLLTESVSIRHINGSQYFGNWCIPDQL